MIRYCQCHALYSFLGVDVWLAVVCARAFQGGTLEFDDLDWKRHLPSLLPLVGKLSMCMLKGCFSVVSVKYDIRINKK